MDTSFLFWQSGEGRNHHRCRKHAQILNEFQRLCMSSRILGCPSYKENLHSPANPPSQALLKLQKWWEEEEKWERPPGRHRCARHEMAWEQQESQANFYNQGMIIQVREMSLRMKQTNPSVFDLKAEQGSPNSPYSRSSLHRVRHWPSAMQRAYQVVKFKQLLFA